MLLKSKISEHQISLDPVLNEKYDAAKLGKFTSSEWHYLMAEKGIGSAGLNYIYRKVGERMTGIKSRADISTAATEHGLAYEREGLIKFGKQMGLESLLVQRLILDEDGYCGGTPDGLIVLNESTDGLSYNVQSCEIKCPLSFDGYIRAFKCKTPLDLRIEFREWYFQCLHQMDLCGAMDAFFIVYHPFFKSGQINIIKFNKLDIVKKTSEGGRTNDFKLINERKQQAIKIFDETIKELTNEKK
jgi:hypothetical protein